MLYINSKLPKTSYDDLKKCDKKSVCIIDGLFTTTELNKIEIPLSSAMDLEAQKEFCVDVATLCRIQYAIYNLCSVVFSREARKDKENKDYFVYFANRVTTKDEELEKLFAEPKKNQKKRESSKKTKAKAEAKKAEAKKAEAKKAEAEAKADDEWTVRATKELSKYLVSRFKVTTKDLNGLEDDLLKILRSIK